MLTTFHCSSVAASNRPPVMTSCLARPVPARSASRCGPPIDGVRPTTISTSPNFADSAAMMMSQASESSKAAVRVRPWAEKTTGRGRASMLSIRPSRSVHRPDPCAGVESLELLDVHSAGNDLAFGTDQEGPRRIGLDPGDRFPELADQAGVEQVEGRAVDGDGRQGTVGGGSDQFHDAKLPPEGTAGTVLALAAAACFRSAAAGPSRTVPRRASGRPGRGP